MPEALEVQPTLKEMDFSQLYDLLHKEIYNYHKRSDGPTSSEKPRKMHREDTYRYVVRAVTNDGEFCIDVPKIMWCERVKAYKMMTREPAMALRRVLDEICLAWCVARMNRGKIFDVYLMNARRGRNL
ncbi:hypothetical protein NHQ30_008403 [Ciborinia camelliae]|nr:hypothetical protein NHQ30_008403 [Ciborinia camelliae]